MDAVLLSIGGRRILACRPRSDVFGLLVADLTVVFHVAKAAGSELLLLGDGSEASSLVRLEVPGVARIDARSMRGRLARAVWALSRTTGESRRLCSVAGGRALDVAVRIVRASTRMVREVAAAVANVPPRLCFAYNGIIRAAQRAWRRTCATAPLRRQRGEAWLERRLLPKMKALPVRDRVTLIGGRTLRAIERHRRPPWRKREIHFGYDIRKLAASRSLGVRFSRADEARAQELARRRGLLPGMPLVTLHVREARPESEAARHQARNARIETYLPAIDELVTRGYRVVRIGDSTMTPVRHPGVDDLATSPERESLLEFWSIAHSRFLLASDSGPYLLSWLLEVPCLSVNIVNLVGVFPLRPNDLYLVKRLRDTSTGRDVPLREMLTERFVYSLRRRLYKQRTLAYIDNSADDILDAVREMLAQLEKRTPETPSQAEFRVLVSSIRAGSLSRDKQFDKTGLAEPFLGEGRVADSFASRFLDPVLA